MITEIIKNDKIEFELKSFSIDINKELSQHVIIFEKGKSNVSIFSDFFIDRIGSFCLINHSLNTKLNFYGYPIVKFLNFIFNDSLTPITNINDLKIEMVEEFLNLYSRGELPNDDLDRWRNAQTVEKANNAISNFIYWLYNKKNKERTKKLFNLKYIKSTDFNFIEKTTKSRNGLQTFHIKKLDKLVIPQMTRSKTTRKKVTRANMYSILKLIELSQSQDPMLTFGLVLGAFAGLRMGDICQLTRERLIGFDNDYAGMFVDLTKDFALRSDGIITSNIKTKRVLPVHEAFIDIVKDYYQQHIDYLIENNLNTNVYGAIFLNKNGKAMTSKTYLNRFNKLYQLLYLNILQEAQSGNKKSIMEKEIIEEGRFTPHSLRYFFTQFIEETENGNQFAIKHYRADKNIKSQEIYKKGSTIEQIRLIQEQIYKEIREIKEGN